MGEWVMKCKACGLEADSMAEVDGWKRALVRGQDGRWYVQAGFCPLHEWNIMAYVVNDNMLGVQSVIECGPWGPAVEIQDPNVSVTYKPLGGETTDTWKPMTSAPKDRPILVKRPTDNGEEVFIVLYTSEYETWTTLPGIVGRQFFDWSMRGWLWAYIPK